MDSAYLESSVYIAIFNGEDEAREVQALVREIRKERAKICTSILTVQEVSVVCYRSGGTQVDNYSKVERMTDRIYGVNREIVLIAAQLEAQILDRAKATAKEKPERQQENKRRKMDCFHIATALHLNCHRLYSFDPHFESYATLPIVRSLTIAKPKPKGTELFGTQPGLRIN